MCVFFACRIEGILETIMLLGPTYVHISLDLVLPNNIILKVMVMHYVCASTAVILSYELLSQARDRIVGAEVIPLDTMYLSESIKAGESLSVSCVSVSPISLVSVIPRSISS